jgi:hypothetical protein
MWDLRCVGEIDKYPLAVAQRRDPDESANRFDVATGFTDETPDIGVGKLDLDRHRAGATVKRLHQNLFRLLCQSLSDELD